MKGARINFGVPNSEYVLLADDDGVALSLKNQDTDTEYIGGGGSSDFSTATLTVINNSENAVEFMCPVVLEDEAEFLFYPIENETTTYTIILYKNSALGQFVGVNGISGNIEDDGDDYYIITGDCAVTIPANT